MRQLDRAKEEARRAESRAAKLQERLQDAERHAGQVGFCMTSEPVHAEAGMSCCIKPSLACYLSGQAPSTLERACLLDMDRRDWASAEHSYGKARSCREMLETTFHGSEASLQADVGSGSADRRLHDLELEAKEAERRTQHAEAKLAAAERRCGDMESQQRAAEVTLFSRFDYALSWAARR